MQLFKNWFAFTIAPLCFGGGGGSTSSSSSNTTNTTTNNTDKRMVTSDNAIALSGDGSSIHITQSDSGAMKTASDLFRMSADANATNYDKLLNTSGTALQSMFGFATKGLDTAVKMMDTGQNKGTLDNKTIALLGAGALLVVGIFAFRK